MRTDAAFMRELEGYLDDYEGATPLPDTVRRSLRREVARTRQIGRTAGLVRDLGGALRIRTITRYVAVAAAMIVVAIAVNIALRQPGFGGPRITPTPTLSPSPVPLADGPLAAGRYVTTVSGVSFVVTVPDGWTGEPPEILRRPGEEPESGWGAAVVDNLYVDPCIPEEGQLAPAPGPTIDDLAAAFAALPRYTATNPVEVTVDGYRALRMELTAPAADPECTNDLRVWLEGPSWNLDYAGQHRTLWIVDVDGDRRVIEAWDLPGAPAAAIAELQALVESTEISR